MRLFLAIDPPPSMRVALLELQAALKPVGPGWRWLRPASIHLTVRFLGEVGEDLDRRGRDRWRSAAANSPTFRFGLEALGRFPPKGRPRILWVGLKDQPSGALAGLAHAVESSARALGFEPERRSFQPHLTLARAVRGKQAVDVPARRLDPQPTSLASELVLFRSELDSAGARYTSIESFPLAGAEN